MASELQQHLFRHEAGRMVAALTRIFGVHNLSLAQDVVQEAFCRALSVWSVQGVPENPSAWLMTTARNRALDLVRQQRTQRRFAPELGRLLDTEWTLEPAVAEAFLADTVRDEQLRMMFSCCQPRLAEQAQLALILHILCGFGVAEIAAAFLCGQAAIEKRIARGKRLLASSRRLFALDDQAFLQRLATVRRALYLLFNEGYHGASAEPVRAELCGEAVRLVLLLLSHPPADLPETNALAALFCLHAARLPARIDAAGELSALIDQDRSRWDARLIERGLVLFERSASGQQLTALHLQAAIAVVHTSARSLAETDWSAVVSLYDRLLLSEPSPVVALNRAIAIGQRDGPACGIAALTSISGRERLARYPFFAAALAELELARSNRAAARAHFAEALRLARNDAERRFLRRRLACCG